MSTLFLDLETFSELPLKTCGAHRYAEEAEVLLVAWAWDDEPVEVIDCTGGVWAAFRPGMQQAIDRAETIVIHNSAFDRAVLKQQGVVIPADKVEDTMVMALAHSLPGSLGELGDVMGLPSDKAKDKAGKDLIRLFSKPRPKNAKLRRATRETNPEEWQRFIEYARLDVDAMRELRGRLPRWNHTRSERRLWVLDQEINDRGVAVDVELARAALRAADRASRSLGAAITEITGGAVTSATQRGRLLDYLKDVHRFDPGDLTAGMIDSWLKVDLDPTVRRLLEIRRSASATSPAKYKVVIDAASAGDRLRGTLQFCGASRTGRWGGRLFQPQNLPRPVMEAEDIEIGIEAMKADSEDLLFDNVMDLCTSAVRGCIVAPKGKKLVISDLSNIEGRMLAWLADEGWKLKAFADFDKGIGHDLYKVAYGRSFGKDPGDVTKDERQIGKVQELALGYQGGPGAFNTMAALYGVVLPEEQVLSIVKAWRKAHPNVVNLWYNTERAAIAAVRDPGLTTTSGPFKFKFEDGWLRMRLPSGRNLCYPGAEVNEDGKLTYMGTNQYTRKWERLATYGGKLIENATQACSRDVLAAGLIDAEAAGYKIVLHVHDELITEVPDSDEYTHEGLSAIMATNPAWSGGLPLAAAGFQTYRYRKD